MSNVLRSKTNFLIALLALADLLACGGFLIVRDRALLACDGSTIFQNGVFDILQLYDFFTLALCAYINVPGTTLCNVESALMLVLGIDRLFAVISPTRLESLQQFKDMFH